MTNSIVINAQIKFSSLRVIEEDGNPLGIMSLTEATQAATSRNLDLILITDQSNPPVAKIADANKYQYEVKKRTKEQQKKARQAAVEIKEIKLRPQIGDHDLGIKMNQTQKFINKNAKVKITIQLRGREIERGRDVLTTILSEIEDRLVNFKFDQPLQQAGNRIVGVIIKDG